MKPLQRARDGLHDFWIDHLWVDLAVVATLLVAHGTLVLTLPSFDVLGNALPADRRATYSATAVVVSLLGSLSAVAIGQLGSARGQRAAALKAQAAEELAQNWRSIFRVGMLAALVSLVALLLDPSVATANALPVVIRWLFEASVLLALVKFLRLSALFHEVLTLTARSAAEAEQEQSSLAPPPLAKPDWVRRAS